MANKRDYEVRFIAYPRLLDTGPIPIADPHFGFLNYQALQAGPSGAVELKVMPGPLADSDMDFMVSSCAASVEFASDEDAHISSLQMTGGEIIVEERHRRFGPIWSRWARRNDIPAVIIPDFDDRMQSLD